MNSEISDCNYTEGLIGSLMLTVSSADTTPLGWFIVTTSKSESSTMMPHSPDPGLVPQLWERLSWSNQLFLLFFCKITLHSRVC